MTARVTRPDGSTETLELFDNGRDAAGHGDDMAGDGIFTGVYTNTNLKGAYAFQVSAVIDKWRLSHDAHDADEKLESPRFMRETRVSAAVGDPGDRPTEPEDDRNPPRDWCRICCWLFWITLFLLLVALFFLWRCCWRNRLNRTVG